MTTSMTRQHFQAIASAIAQTPGLTVAQRQAVAESVADALYPFNSRFDRDRFERVATTNIPSWAQRYAQTYGIPKVDHSAESEALNLAVAEAARTENERPGSHTPPIQTGPLSTLN